MARVLVVSDSEDDVAAMLKIVDRAGLDVRWWVPRAAYDPAQRREHGWAAPPGFEPAKIGTGSGELGYEGEFTVIDDLFDRLRTESADVLFMDLNWFGTLPVRDEALASSYATLQELVREPDSPQQLRDYARRRIAQRPRETEENRRVLPALVAALVFKLRNPGGQFILASNALYNTRSDLVEAGARRDDITPMPNICDAEHSVRPVLQMLERLQARTYDFTGFCAVLEDLVSNGVHLEERALHDALHDVLVTNTPLRQEAWELFLRFLGLHEEGDGWQARASEGGWFVEGFKSLVGVRTQLSASAAWLLAVAGFNNPRFARYEEHGWQSVFQSEDFVASRHDLDSLFLTAERSRGDHLELAGVFYEFCRYVAVWDPEHAPRECVGRSALRGVSVARGGSIALELAFSVRTPARGRTESLAARLYGIAKGKAEPAGRTVSHLLWQFISLSMVGDPRVARDPTRPIVGGIARLEVDADMPAATTRLMWSA